MNEFKVGDKVYCPKLSRKVLVPQETVGGLGSYPLTISINDTHYYFTFDGKYSSLDEVPSFHHATEENHALLEKLYGVEFEKPPAKPASKEIIQAMLDRGDKYIACWVSDDNPEPNEQDRMGLIYKYVEYSKYPYRCEDNSWKYATPFDIRTRQPITELPE